MTDAVALVATLRAAGVRLALVDGRVQVKAAAGVLTDRDRAALRDHREEVLAVLQAEAPPATANRCAGRNEGAERAYLDELRRLYDCLTDAEHERLLDEVEPGNPGARLVRELATAQAGKGRPRG